MYCFQWHYTCTKIWVEVSNFWLQFGYFLSICEACGKANTHSDHYIIALSLQTHYKFLSFPVAFKKTIWGIKVHGLKDTSTKPDLVAQIYIPGQPELHWDWREGIGVGRRTNEQTPIILVDAKWKLRALTYRKPFPECLSSSHTSKTAVSHKAPPPFPIRTNILYE